MLKHFNNLTPGEAERLALLLEEMGEAQQIIGKILRHGYESTHPEDSLKTNRLLLEKELGDVLFAISLMLQKGDINEGDINCHKYAKSVSVDQYLHHQDRLA